MTTKRLSIVLISSCLMVSAFAINKDLESDITMVSYEQSWLDSKGTLALKNNTSEEINNLVFVITYLDMSGNELDYEEFNKRINIDPGMTKKLDIPAYEHSRNYHYYKTKDDFGHPAFKIKFKLKDYNIVEEEKEEEKIEDVDDYIYDYDLHQGHEYRYDKGDSFSLVIIGAIFLLVIVVV